MYMDVNSEFTVSGSLSWHAGASRWETSASRLVNKEATPQTPIYDRKEPKTMRVGAQAKSFTTAALFFCNILPRLTSMAYSTLASLHRVEEHVNAQMGNRA
jgi:hypothetical protein